MRNRLAVSGVVAGVVFAVGLVSPFLVPGGGSVTDKDFTDFYDSSGRRAAAYALYFVLLVGCWLMIWFFSEVRARLVATSRSEVAYRLALGGAVAVMVGGAIDLGPAGVQINSGNSSGFVGVPIAHAVTQSALLTIIAGLFTFAASVLLLGIEFRRSPAFPNWLGVLSIVAAILLLASYLLIGAFVLPIWAIIVGIVAARDRHAAPVLASG